MGQRREYGEDVKAAVMAALLLGQSVNAVARAYELPKQTVSNWKKAARAAVPNLSTQKENLPPIDELLRAYVNENLITLREQAKFFRDPEWLQQQEASALAVLHGVLTDKSIRLLEIFGAEPDVP